MIDDRGIDGSRMILVPVTTVQEFRTNAIQILDKYLEQKTEERKPMMFVLAVSYTHLTLPTTPYV